MDKKVILMILDGWGLAKNKKVSAIDQANTPFMDSLFDKYPNCRLEASGEAVGLPMGQMGNSEVGHMNIGAGRIVYQDLVKINLAFEKNTISENKVLQKAFHHAQKNNSNIHLMGLVSDGGVHSHINHLKGLCSLAHKNNLNNVFVHAFMDGRDTDPKRGLAYINQLENHLSDTTGKIASVIGRYYAMDRDKRWERTKLAYDLLTKGEGEKFDTAANAIKDSYEQNITDEFIKPKVMVSSDNQPLAKIKNNDVVICFNFRTDRGRQITQALTQTGLEKFDLTPKKLNYYTMTNYDDTFDNVNAIFSKDNLTNTVGEVLEKNKKTQVRVAETEKYPHVTFFFSGGRETPFENEKRILCPSPKVATYDLRPEMSAQLIEKETILEVKNNLPNFICMNFANPDMVGHTGVFEAAVKACQTVDTCAQNVVKVALKYNYTVLIIADHGNSDLMINEDGSPNTAHTTNLVPCIFVDNTFQGKVRDGKLADIAPTILSIMNLNTPSEMTGNNLIL